MIVVSIDIQAEDGTTEEYSIYIYKRANVDLNTVIVDDEVVDYDEELQRYYKKVGNATTPEVTVTTSNSLQTVQLLDSEGTVIAEGVGSVTELVTLSTTDLETSFVIKVISHNGEDYGSQEYDLVLTQKSTETGITYVKVDSLGTSLSEDKLTYSSTVAGKESYPVEIKLKDENAEVRVKDSEGNILIKNQTGILTGNLTVEDGEEKEFIMVVTSENGDEKEYTLVIKRVSSNLEIESITVTDYDTDGSSLITRNIVNYDKTTKTYKIVVNKELNSSDIVIKTVSDETNIMVDDVYTQKGTLTFTKTLNGLGISQSTVNLTAEDGTQDVRYIQIIQLSDEIGIQSVEVDKNVVMPNEAGDYEYTVTDEVDLAEVTVTLPVSTSKVSINGTTDQTQTSTVNVSKGTNRKLIVPIQVTAEDGTTYIYHLTLNIISHNANVKTVKVEGEESNFVNEKYIGYFDKNLTEVSIEITSVSEYSNIIHINEDGEEEIGIGTLVFVMNTEDLEKESYETTFEVIAEDGNTKEYVLEIRRKSDDNTIQGVYVNNKELEPNVNHLIYSDGTYYVAVTENTAKVKVTANNELTSISFGGKTSIKELEQTITLDTENKITEVPVIITSQQGSIYETIIYIEKVSDNNNLTSVKVNKETAEEGEEENSFLAYIYDTVTNSEVEITAEEELTKIVRTTETGETYLNENGLSNQGYGTLTVNVGTTEQVTTMYFKLISESGEETEIYKVQIEKMSTDATIKEVYVDGVEILLNEEGKYVANVLDTVTNPTIKVVTSNKFANVRIALGNEALNIVEDKVTLSESKQTVIPITVRSQSGTTKVTYLYINKLSTSVALDTVTLDGNEANTYNENTHTYRFMVDNEKTSFELFVLPESDLTILEYEGIDYEASLMSIIDVAVEEQGKTLKVIAKSEAGINQEYTIEIARKSDNTNLEYLKVDDVIRQPDEEGGDTYTVIIPKFATTTLLEVKTEYAYATVRLGDNEIQTGYDKGELDCSDLTEDRIVVPVVVTAADGTTIRTYNVVLIRDTRTYITGKILTENVNEEHISEVTVYKTNDTATPKTEIAKVQTEIDGTFRILMYIAEEEYMADEDKNNISDVLEENYDIVVTKEGYLSYTVTDIEISEGLESVIEDYKLKAGDVVESGQIEIDDLVKLNDNYGEIITEDNKEEKGIYDLNEDGVVDKLDRDILKKNYVKKAETVKWINPSEIVVMSLRTIAQTVDYILPINCEYVISSDYGERIHPITGEESFHSGIDIVGEHHTEILAVAGGEITYAGVQSGYGNCIEIKHEVNGETIYSFYAHLSRIDVEQGDKVEQGEVIGLEGGEPGVDENAGTSTGHHLHFELRTASGSGNSIDPKKYIEF